MGFRQRAIAVLLLLGGVSSSEIGSGDTRPQPTVPTPRDFAEFLIARDLVVEGTVVSVERVRRQPLGGCGIEGLSEMKALDVRIDIDRVRFGTAEDSVIMISVRGHRDYPSGLESGTRVLAWAFHDCHDGWRLWGNLCVITPSGRIVPAAGSEESVFLLGAPPGEPIRYSALDSALTQQAFAHTTSLFEGQAAVATARLVQTIRRGAAGFTYECDSVGWALGNGSRVPRYVDFPRVPDCYPQIFRGDTLLIPLPAGFAGDRLELTTCPRSLRVKRGYAPGLGVPVGFLSYALRTEHDSLRVRSFVGRD